MTPHALLFTDLVDSTLLVEQLGDARAVLLWTEHDRRARQLLARHRGREIDRTDGFFLLFDDVADAARYAVGYHQAMAELQLSARVGIHVGPVTLRDNDPADVARGAKRVEVEGLAKPFAARIMALARGGQTLLSPSVREALDAALPEGSQIDSHGHYRLKGVEEPVEIFELGHDRSAFAPPPDTDKVYRVVRSGELWRPLREVRHNLVPERDAFIGRAADLRALAQKLDTGARLLTVLGPGGTGKTRLVRRYGLAWLGDWPGGVYFCDLSEARSLEGIHFAVALALGVPLGKDDPSTQLGHAIAGRGRCLVMLDNFEQVLEHAPATLGRWLDRAAQAAFVVTTRERLHLPGEDLFPVEPLPLQTEAIELFAARAKAQRPEFVLNQANRGAVAEVVRLLDGLPLAIELAAARVRVLSPGQIVERMRDRFKLLAGAKGAAARQATLKAAIDWSWDLLTPWEQAALAQCSVFEGGFTIEAAEAVLDLSPWSEASPMMDIVQALVDKSLLRAWVPLEHSRFDIDEPYFGMYLSIHEYAAAKLQANGPGATPAAQWRHGIYFAAFGTDEAIEALARHGGVRRRQALSLEIGNLVAACRRAVGREDSAIAVPSYRGAWAVLELQGPLMLGSALGAQVCAIDMPDLARRGAAVLTRGLALAQVGQMHDARRCQSEVLAWARESGDRRREANALGLLGTLYREQGLVEQAREHLELALSIQRETGQRGAQGLIHGYLGNLEATQGWSAKAQAQYEVALSIAIEVGDRRAEGGALGNLGTVHREQGRMEEARIHYERGLAIHRELGDRRYWGGALANLAVLHHEQGETQAAGEYYQQALAIVRDMGSRSGEGTILGNLGVLHLDQGRTAEARVCYGRALEISRELADRRYEGMILGNLGILHWNQSRIDEARTYFEAALAIHRAVANRREEGVVMDNLGSLLSEQHRDTEAQRQFEAALVIHREVGHRRAEGLCLGNLGDVLARTGRVTEARDAFRAGEVILREQRYQLELAKLLCQMGHAEAAVGTGDVARAALAEAESIAAGFDAKPNSELGRQIAQLRATIA